MPTDRSYAQLDQEVQDLRRLVDDLHASLATRRQVTVRARERQRYLGQPVSIVATVTAGPDRIPAVGVPVTFATTWGRLSPAELNAPSGGSTVTVATSASGAASVKLLPPVSPDLLAPQQALLVQLLDLLDPTADTPRTLELGLSWLASVYRWETNVDVRRAIDIYVRDLRPDLLDAINERDDLDEWSYVDALLTAYVPEESGALESAAVLPVRCKDWLGPWLQIYQQTSADANTLPDNFTWLATGLEKSARITDRVYDRVRAHLEDQPGLIGKRTGGVVAERAIRTFLDTGVAELPPLTRANLSRTLVETASSVAESAPVVTAVGDIRADLREDVAGKADRADLTSLAETVDGQLGAKVDASAFDSALAAKLDSDTFEGFRAETGEALRQRATIGMLENATRGMVDASSFEARLATKADLSSVEEGLAAKVDVASFDRFAVEINEAIGNRVLTDAFTEALDTLVNRAVFEARLADKPDLAMLDARLATKVDAAEFEAVLSRKVDVDTFDRFREEVRDTPDRFVTTERFDQALARLVDTSVLDERLAGKPDLRVLEEGLSTKADTNVMDERLAAKVDTTTLDQRLATKVDATTLDQRLAAKVDTTTFDQRLATKVDTTTFNSSLAKKVDRTTFQTVMATKVDRAAFETTVAELRTDFSGVRTRRDIIDNR